MKQTLQKQFITFCLSIVLAMAGVIAFAQGSGGINLNSGNIVNGDIRTLPVVAGTNTLIVKLYLQSGSRRLGPSTLMFKYNHLALQLEADPAQEHSNNHDNVLDNNDYIFNNQINAANGYSNLRVQRRIIYNADQVTPSRYVAYNTLYHDLTSTNIPKALDLNSEQEIVTLKFSIIADGNSGFSWDFANDQFEIITMDYNGNDSVGTKGNFTAQNVDVQFIPPSGVLGSTGGATTSNPLKITMESQEFDRLAGSAGFYVYFRSADANYLPAYNTDYLINANGFNWPIPATITLEDDFGYMFKGTNNIIYDRRIKYVNNDGDQNNDIWLADSAFVMLSLAFERLNFKDMEIYIEPVTGQESSFKDYIGTDYSITSTQRTIPYEEVTTPLPVSLTSLTARVDPSGKGVKLDWTTASEIDNKEFIVERSTNALNFTAIGKVQGGGTSTTTLSYTYLDRSPLAGTVYYRLKQIDLDGDFEHSKIVSVQSIGSRQAPATVYAYPNPFQKSLQVIVTLDAQAPIYVTLIEIISGKTVLRTTLAGEIGEYTYPVEGTDQITNGVYLLKVEAGGKTSTSKVIKN